MNNETVGLIGLSSAGAWSGATVNNSPYDIIAQSATNGTGGFDINNYNITYINGKLTVNPLPVIITPPTTSNPQAPAPITIAQPLVSVIVPPIQSTATHDNFIENVQNLFWTPTSDYFVYQPDINQLVPLQTSTTGIKHAHELRWFYKHWLNDIFAKTRYAWLFNDAKHYLKTLIANRDVEIVNQGMKLPK